MRRLAERRAALLPVFLAALSIGAAPPSPGDELAYLKASNAGFNDEFGTSVATSGDTVVVGARGEASAASGVNGDEGNNGASGSGAVYVFVRSGATWSQQAYLKASNSHAGDDFGRRVAISGDTIVVGAPAEDSSAAGVNGDESDDGAPGAGAAYVFVRSGTTWSQQAYLKASNTQLGDAFGRAVAISGDTIVVGTTEEDSSATGVDGDESDDGAAGSGAAYVFVRSGTTWSQQAYLKASNTGADDGFASSVSVSGDTVVIGAPAEASGVEGDPNDNSLVQSGAAYVFTRSGTTWTQEAYLKALSEPGDHWLENFGYAVSISGETLAVGAPRSGLGGAYVFVRSGTTWTVETYLRPLVTDRFGGAVAIDGDYVMGGVGLSSFSGNPVYVFERSGTSWTETGRLEASNASSADYFGAAVGLAGSTAVVGAFNEASAATGVDGDGSDNSLHSSGAAYVFDAPHTIGAPYCSPAVPNSTGSPGRLIVTGSSIAAYDSLLLRATSLPVVPGVGHNLGYFVMGTGTNTFTPPGSAGPLCVAPGLQRFLPPPQNTEELEDGGFRREVGTSGPVSSAITAGSTWNFQAWHRDLAAGTSNFTDAVSVTFQ